MDTSKVFRLWATGRTVSFKSYFDINRPILPVFIMAYKRLSRGQGKSEALAFLSWDKGRVRLSMLQIVIAYCLMHRDAH